MIVRPLACSLARCTGLTKERLTCTGQLSHLSSSPSSSSFYVSIRRLACSQVMQRRWLTVCVCACVRLNLFRALARADTNSLRRLTKGISPFALPYVSCPAGRPPMRSVARSLARCSCSTWLGRARAELTTGRGERRESDANDGNNNNNHADMRARNNGSRAGERSRERASEHRFYLFRSADVLSLAPIQLR